VLDLVLVFGNEAFPALCAQFRDAIEPARIELGALVFLEKILARAAVALGKPHHAALVADETLEGGDLVEVQQKVSAKAEAKEPTERTDDPVRMYLREMGWVELLSREGEIAIELVAPNDDGLERERALAQPGDHRLAAGLDARCPMRSRAIHPASEAASAVEYDSPVLSDQLRSSVRVIT